MSTGTGTGTDPADENPYAAPASKRDGSALTDVYKVSLRGMSAKDLRALTKSRFGFAVFRLLQALRVPIASTTGTPLVDRLEEVAEASLPEATREALRPLEDACRDAGLSRRALYRSPLIAPGPPDFGAIFSDDQGRVMANLLSQWERPTPPGKMLASLVAWTSLRGGGCLTSSNNPWWVLDPPPGTERRDDPQWSARELLGQHQRWAIERADEVEPVDPARLLDEQSAREREIVRELIDRRVLVPMTERELNTLLQQVEAGPPQPPPDSPRLARLKRYEALAFLAMLGFLVGFVFLGQPGFQFLGQPDVLSAYTLVGAGLAVVALLALTIARRLVARSERKRTRA